MKNKTTYFLFRLLVLFYVLWGGYAWFTWVLETEHSLELMVYAVGLVITVLYQITNKVKIRPQKGLGAALLVLFVLYLYSGGFSGTGYLTAPIHFVLRFYPIVVLACDRENAEGHLKFITKAIAVILTLGMALYLVMQFLPLVPGIPIHFEEASESYVFFHYYILVRNIYWTNDFWRFSSIFLEPSYLATVCVFLLFANQYDFHKRENIIIGLAVILSTSLAGYLVGMIGYVLIRIVNHKVVTGFMVLLIVAASIYAIGVNYNKGNNLINQFIVERLQYDEEKFITGNNRTGENINALYDQMVKNGSILWGIGNERLDKEASVHGSGYKMVFIRSGIISALMLFLFYWFVGVSGSYGFKKRYMVAYLVLYIIMFIPDAAVLSYLWLIPFILSSTCVIKKTSTK